MNDDFKTDYKALGLQGVNAFDTSSHKPPPTPGELKAEALRIANLASYHKKTALRVNRHTFTISPTPQADMDRTACISGKKNRARSA